MNSSNGQKTSDSKLGTMIEKFMECNEKQINSEDGVMRIITLTMGMNKKIYENNSKIFNDEA